MPKTMSVSFISEVDKGYEECYKPPSGVSRNLGCRFIWGSPFIHQLFVLNSIPRLKSRKSP